MTDKKPHTCDACTPVGNEIDRCPNCVEAWFLDRMRWDRPRACAPSSTGEPRPPDDGEESRYICVDRRYGPRASLSTGSLTGRGARRCRYILGETPSGRCRWPKGKGAHPVDGSCRGRVVGSHAPGVVQVCGNGHVDHLPANWPGRWNCRGLVVRTFDHVVLW